MGLAAAVGGEPGLKMRRPFPLWSSGMWECPKTTRSAVGNRRRIRAVRPCAAPLSWIIATRSPPRSSSRVSGAPTVGAVVVALDHVDRRVGGEFVEHPGDADVTRVQDQVGVPEMLGHTRRTGLPPPRGVGVGQRHNLHVHSVACPPGFRRSGSPWPARRFRASHSAPCRSSVPSPSAGDGPGRFSPKSANRETSAGLLARRRAGRRTDNRHDPNFSEVFVIHSQPAGLLCSGARTRRQTSPTRLPNRTRTSFTMSTTASRGIEQARVRRTSGPPPVAGRCSRRPSGTSVVSVGLPGRRGRGAPLAGP